MPVYAYKHKDTIEIIPIEPDEELGGPEQSIQPASGHFGKHVQYDVPNECCYIFSNTLIDGLELVDHDAEPSADDFGGEE